MKNHVTLDALLHEAVKPSVKNRKARRSVDATSLADFLASEKLMSMSPYEFLKVQDDVLYNLSLMARREEEKRSEKFKKWARWEARKCKELYGRPESEWYGKK